MTDKKEMVFNGFSKKSIDFLRNLEANNNKVWFEANRHDYKKHVLDPLQKSVIDLGEFMLAIDPFFETRPTINKTISRIYRDARFSNGISLYRSTMWITFKRPNKDWRDAPAYFFEISPDSYRYGMGYCRASTYTMYKFREMIDKKPKEFLKAISFYSRQKEFVIEGEKYKKILDKNKPDKLLDWYQRKNLYMVCNRSVDGRLFSRALIGDLISGFSLLKPFYHYLRKIKSRQIND